MSALASLKKPENLQHFLTMGELTKEDIYYLLEDSIDMKQKQKAGQPTYALKDKVLGMIFEKSSTRTRVSFEVGMHQLGGKALFLSSADIQIGRGETVHDTAKVLSRYVDGLMIRTFEHEKIEEFAMHATVPVINGLTDLHHPTQVLADLMTIYEHKGKLEGLKLCYIGDGNNNMCHSLLEGAAKVGMSIAVASPKGYEPNSEILATTKKWAEAEGETVTFHYEATDAIKHADVVITDVWTSMGQEEENATRMQYFEPYQVNEELVKNANENYLFLHCLPAHRGEEVTTEVIDGKHSVVFDEAENRLHAQKSILKLLMG